jgi:spoIIIJ-associated protein
VPEVRVEATGETVGEAKWSALRELELLAPTLDKAAVRFEVVSEGERGLLGVGYAPARVVAVVDADVAEAPEESPLAADLRDVVHRVAQSLGVSGRIVIEEDDERVTVSLEGSDLAHLIGRHGQTIDALQFLANAIVARTYGDDRKEVVVDAAGYRERRRATLESLARRSAERALASGSRVELDPMTAVERKVVHTVLQEVPGVMTSSEGAEPNRYVVVELVERTAD